MTARVRVRVAYPIAPADREMLAAVDPRLDIVYEGEDDQASIDGLDDPDVEVLSGSYAPTDPDRMPRLRWIASCGAGIEDLLAVDPWSRGITVVNGSGLHAVAMGQYVLGAVLLRRESWEARLAARHLPLWGEGRFGLAGERLRGSLAVIVGYGSIGREAARLLHGCGVRIVAVKADPTARRDQGWMEPGTGDPEGDLPERWVGPDGLLDFLPDAHHVVLSTPATPRTRGLIDARALGAMRPDAWIVNVGRGSLIDEPALIDALRSGRIGGAVLDVTSEEPLPADHPLRALPNCVVTPHVSGLGGIDGFWHNAATLLAANLRRDLAGEPLLNVTSGTAGY